MLKAAMREVPPHSPTSTGDALDGFHPVTAAWFRATFAAPTAPQQMGWPAIARGDSTLILAPTGTGKTLTAFLWCLDQLMLAAKKPHAGSTEQACLWDEEQPRGCRVIYVSPLKALAFDVERNLRAPLLGIAQIARDRNVDFRTPAISVRTGDTPAKERARFLRHPAEILITTPESLYLMLTSQVAENLRTVDTIIIDEIHALVSTKRGAHLALSLERLEALTQRPLQRIGLSATQRPLEEVAHFLAGTIPPQDEPHEREKRSEQAQDDPIEETGEGSLHFRPVTIIDASAPKRLKLRIEVPVEDMARLNKKELAAGLPGERPAKRVTIWNAIHPRLLELIRAHSSTILFVNSRQIAERLAGALNELAGEEIARAHHGSLAAAQRTIIEEQLKAGQLKALCATSTLELGIDMGAVDLVVQIEAPPSVASGMQRIGRAGHSINAISEGTLFPKYRADLVACAAVTRAMHDGAIEATRYPRNPLDVLAQQIVAIIAHPPSKKDAVPADDLFMLVRRAAPFATLTREGFDGVLDLLSGRYPSDEFAELRPRLNWDRNAGTLTARPGAGRIAILNAGTIPDRGLYGVFLAHDEGKPVRVGELDEEMVFESKQGDNFILGASTWRISEITHDRVLVTPASGEPGKMPFWKGDGPGRPLEFGRRIGALVRALCAVPRKQARARLIDEHDLDPNAADNLLDFLGDQQAATGVVPDDLTIVIERCKDELGDWRVCVLTPFGSRIHIPWAMAIAARIRAANGPEVETLWADDGFVLRFPDTEAPPDTHWFLLESTEAMQLVLRQLGSTALFAGRFREAAGRALLLPRRRSGQRSPLWQLRKRASDLLSVAARYPKFPLLLETYRECLRDVFDMPALLEVLRSIEQRQLRVHIADTSKPSPFAASLLFSYVGNYIYDSDAPLAERRAQALTIDQDQLRALMGEADLRELLDAGAIAEVEESAQRREQQRRARTLDDVHDLLLRLGDLTREELAQRIASPVLLTQIDRLLQTRRVLVLPIAGESRLIAAEDAARYRDALGLALPAGLPAAFLEPVAHPVLELARRYARTHGPFTTREVASRFALGEAVIEDSLHQLLRDGRVLEGGFRPMGIHREWCDAEILRQIRRKSLARLRRAVEPVEQRTLARFTSHWQGLLAQHSNNRNTLDLLLDTIENLQGAPLAASLLETSILPARIPDYDPSHLDTLIAAGEISWMGLDPLGEHDGRIALYLTDTLPLLKQQKNQTSITPCSEREEKILAMLANTGASFFDALHESTGAGYPGETLDALWSLVWRGLLTNDSLHALRAYLARPETARTPRRQHTGQVFCSRRTTPPTAQGRWSLVATATSNTTEASHARAQQLLHRYGILLREHVAAENISGGFAAIYDVLKTLEESGKIRRGYFVEGLGATQFALPSAVDLLRQMRTDPDETMPEFVQLAATDPANPYGSVLRWPELSFLNANSDCAPRTLTRAVGAEVILRNGALLAWMRRGNPNILVFLPDEDPERTRHAEGLAQFLAQRGQQRLQQHDRQAALITTINAEPATTHMLAPFLRAAGFHASPLGMNLRHT